MGCGGGGLFFLSFMLCNMLGVNVAKSSLPLRFLKTLEFGTAIPEPSGLAASHPPPSCGGPRPETQSCSLPKPFCPSCTLPRLVYTGMIFGHQTSQDLHASALLRGGFLPPSPEPGSRYTTSREGCLALPRPGPPGLRSRCQAPMSKLLCFCFVPLNLFPTHTPPAPAFLMIDFTKESKLLRRF